MIFDFGFMIHSFFDILKLAPVTLEITFVSFFFGFLIGIVIALVRLYKVKGIHYLADFYVSLIRGTPLILQIFIVLYGLPRLFDFLYTTTGFPLAGKDVSSLTFLFIALSINCGAYLSEVIRSGILAIDKGEIEAAHSIGMTAFQMLRRVILPQALAVSLPNLCNSLIGILQGSSLAFFVGVTEMTTGANILGGNNWKYFEAFAAAALVYWGIAVVIEQVMLFLERFLNKKKLLLGSTKSTKPKIDTKVEVGV